MIKFFRKIRRKLIEEENLKRYLIYAIGEILLVMAGILLALQVNNWNEAQLQKKKETQILLEIKNSLEGDLKNELKPGREWFNLQSQKIDLVLQIIRSGQKVTHDSIALLIGDVFFDKWFFNLRTSAFENIKSIGIDLISNDSLRTKISNVYHINYATIKDMSEGYDDYYNVHVTSLINNFFIGRGNGYRKQRLYPRDPITPENIESITTALWQLQQRRGFKQNIGQMAIPEIEIVISQISEEIDRLQN
jgi:hypothetical protein